MKRKTLLLIITTMLCVCIVPVFAQTNWDYPVKSGTDEWKAFKRHSQRIEACRIPQYILNRMSTAELLRAWINYPLRIDMMCFSTLQEGFAKQIGRSDALKELLRRKDSGNAVFEEYMKTDFQGTINAWGTWSNYKKGEFYSNNLFLEFLLSQKKVLNSIPKNKKKELLSEVYQRNNILRDNNQSVMLRSTNIVLMGRFLLNEKHALFSAAVAGNTQLNSALTSGNNVRALHSYEQYILQLIDTYIKQVN